MGSSSPLIRYKDDFYDRIWTSTPESLAYATNLTTYQTVKGYNDFNMSSNILSTAIEAPNQNDSLNISFTSEEPFYVYFHFAELTVLNQTRKANIYGNHDLFYGHVEMEYLTITTIYAPKPYPPGTYSFSIQATADSSAPPLLNAFEAYTVKQFPLSETNEIDGTDLNVHI